MTDQIARFIYGLLQMPPDEVTRFTEWMARDLAEWKAAQEKAQS